MKKERRRRESSFIDSLPYRKKLEKENNGRKVFFKKTLWYPEGAHHPFPLFSYFPFFSPDRRVSSSIHATRYKGGKEERRGGRNSESSPFPFSPGGRMGKEREGKGGGEDSKLRQTDQSALKPTSFILVRHAGGGC